MNPNKIFAKASGDFVGGAGTSGHSGIITRPTRTEKLYASEMVIYLRRHASINSVKPRELIIEVGKDINGDNGVKELPEAIDAIAGLLCRYKFQDGNHMFQNSLKIRLAEVMKEVLMGDDVIPTEQAIKEYIEGGDQDGNNIC